jgi:tRNA (guanine37-N1)-methyltransferase
VRLDVVTIFPDYFAPLDLSLIGKARRDGLLDVRVHDLRDFTHDRHRTVDDTPYGGGAGMVMRPEPWGEALAHVVEQGEGRERPRLVVPGPGGMPFTQAMARQLAAEPWLAFACGRYEGIDERVHEHAAEDLGLQVSVVSLGDYVLNGGEVAVLAMVEAVARLLPGVVGNAESLVEESHEDGLLEYPVYTRPPVWEGRAVPDVLLSGNHAAIAQWRHAQRLARTAERRPDLLHVSHALGGDFAACDLALATPADAPELMVLQRACWLPEVAHVRGEWAGPQEPLEEVVADLGRWSTWILRSGGRLVGSVRARLRPDDPTVWEVGRLMVAPDLHGRGLGRALLAHAESQAPAGCGAYRLTTGGGNERNLRFYTKAGYRVLPGEGTYPGCVDLAKRRR